MPNLPPKMVTADKSWNACGPKSCNVSSESSKGKAVINLNKNNMLRKFSQAMYL